jgi:hypothetical protein
MKKFVCSLKTLFVGGRDGPALARSAFWPVYVLALWRWAHGLDLFHTHYVILLALIGYIFGGKVVHKIGEKSAEFEKNGDDDGKRPGKA